MLPHKYPDLEHSACEPLFAIPVFELTASSNSNDAVDRPSVVVGRAVHRVRVGLVEESVPLGLITKVLPVVSHGVLIESNISCGFSLTHEVQAHPRKRDLGLRVPNEIDASTLGTALCDSDFMQKFNYVLRCRRPERLQRSFEASYVADPKENEVLGFLSMKSL